MPKHSFAPQCLLLQGFDVVGTKEPHRNGHPRDEELLIQARRPGPSDGAAVSALVTRAQNALVIEARQVLPPLMQRFADTSLVAELDDQVVGFVGGYRPAGGTTLTIWQIDVEPALRKLGLATALLHTLIQCPGCRGVEFVEVSVASSNVAGVRLFERFARDVDAPCESIAQSRLDGSTKHGDGELLLIGPIHIEYAIEMQGQHETL
jgi:L-2,4-diaminobutyric acid acetyltransferase